MYINAVANSVILQLYFQHDFHYFDVEYPSWHMYTRNIFQFLREGSVSANTFLCFIKKLFGDQVLAYLAVIMGPDDGYIS
jgi:hypothetical protein